MILISFLSHFSRKVGSGGGARDAMRNEMQSSRQVSERRGGRRLRERRFRLTRGEVSQHIQGLEERKFDETIRKETFVVAVAVANDMRGNDNGDGDCGEGPSLLPLT